MWFAAAILPSVPGDETLDPIDAGLDGLLNGGQSRAWRIAEIADRCQAVSSERPAAGPGARQGAASRQHGGE
ncbi:MAG: hypothetical protein M3319_04375, partial [Actinomycetota bacterium]|nr:hypothetical protein [Actinomycetota bacterium]MDQ3899700.1 hypothetical protein [Actinomycetota bacterium]